MRINFPLYLLICAFTLTSAQFNTIEDYVNLFVGNRRGEHDTEEKFVRDINFVFYPRMIDNTTRYWSRNVLRVTDIRNGIFQNTQLVIYIPGFMETPNSQSTLHVLYAYLDRGFENIIVLDWSNLANDGLLYVAPRLEKIGAYVAQTLDNLVDEGVNPGDIHIIGHSFGAHIAGHIGRKMKTNIARITGLDPAKNLFYPPYCYLTPCYPHINSGDARLVDILHTDGGILTIGVTEPTGDVDFMANGGQRPQPGCVSFWIPPFTKDMCSHERSWEYYAESVRNPAAFPAYHANSSWDYAHGKAYGQGVFYGYIMDPNARGIYYFNTRDSPPYSLGTQ